MSFLETFVKFESFFHFGSGITNFVFNLPVNYYVCFKNPVSFDCKWSCHLVTPYILASHFFFIARCTK